MPLANLTNIASGQQYESIVDLAYQALWLWAKKKTAVYTHDQFKALFCRDHVFQNILTWLEIPTQNLHKFHVQAAFFKACATCKTLLALKNGEDHGNTTHIVEMEKRWPSKQPTRTDLTKAFLSHRDRFLNRNKYE